MDYFFVLLTQIINLTAFEIEFEVVHYPGHFEAVHYSGRLLPELPAGKTRFAKTSEVYRRILKSEKDWKIRVLLGGEFTGIELDPSVMVDYVRVIFRVNPDVLRVEGVPEICGFKDTVFRHRFFGCMRNYSWNGRIPKLIGRSDSKAATELRNKKGHCQYLAPFVDLQKRSAFPQKENPGTNKQNPPTVETTQENKTERMKDDPQPPAPAMRSEERTSRREHKRPKKVRPSPLVASGHVTQSTLKPREPRDVHQPPKPRSGMATRQQARLRDDEPLIPQMRSREQVRLQKPSSLQRDAMATCQQARLRDDEPSTIIVGGLDSFVHGMLLVFALTVWVFMNFIF